MFRIEFFVDDKRLGQALLALVGIANGQPSVTPVVNAAKKANGQLVQKTGGDSLERFAAELKRHKGQTVKAPVIRALMQPIGLAEKSYTYMLTRALEAKLVRRVGAGRGTATTYEVL